MLLLTAALYYPGLGGPLLLDDRQALEPLAAVESGEWGWRRFVFDNEAGRFQRPISKLSFVADWALFGDDVRAFKRTNVALHLVCGLLVFELAICLAARRFSDPERAARIALFVAAAWLLTPIMVSTVLYVVQRMAQLAALFTFAGLLCYARGRGIAESHPARSTVLVALCFSVFWPLAIASKENGAVLPLLAALVELYFFAGVAGPR